LSRYRKVDPRIWNDEKFRSLPDNGKLVFFMLLTHPSMTALGAMRATVSGLAEELGWEREAFAEAFAEALRQGMAEHDPKACLIAIPKFIRYNPPESPNVVKAWAGAVDLLPECALKTTVLHRAKAHTEGMAEGFAKAFAEAFAKAMPKGMPNQEQEQEQKKKPPVVPQGGQTEQPEIPCPYAQIVALYHEHLPSLPRAKVTTAPRQRGMRSFWGWLLGSTKADGSRRATTADEALRWIAGYFAQASENDFLMGRTPRSAEHAGWRCDIDFLMTPKGIKQVVERTKDAA